MSAEPAWSSRLLVVAAAVLWSLSGVVLKSPACEGLPAESRGAALAGLRALFAAMVLLPLVRWRAVRWSRGLIPMTFSFAAMSVLFISAMMETTAAATIFLQYTSVVWASLLGWLILKERPARVDGIAIACTIAGITIILAHDFGSPLGNMLALGSGVAYAGVVVSVRALRDHDPFWLTFLNQCVCAAVLLPLLIMRPPSFSAAQIGGLAFLGAIQLALPYVLFSIGMKRVPAGEASLLLLVEPVLNPLWVLMVWGETTAWTTWVGGAVILGGLVVRFCVAGVQPGAPARVKAPIPASDAAPQSLPAGP